MYSLSEQQIEFILSDIKSRGVEMEDLQTDLLDHICCIMESELEPDGDFESFYRKTISKFFKKELREIEEETILLLTFKHYYAMKKVTIISGIFAVSAFIIGSLFKVMHWPGANMMILLGISLFSLIFLPVMVLFRIKDSGPKRDKVILGLGALVGLMLCIATLFTIFHWPGGGSGILWLIPICISMFVMIPVYFFTGIRNPETKMNTIMTSIILVGATGLLFSMVNLRPAKFQTQIKLHAYIQAEELLNRMRQTQLDTIPSPERSQLADEINRSCEEIKQLILLHSVGQPSVNRSFEDSGTIVEEGSLGDDFFYEDSKGIKLVTKLIEDVNKYNAALGPENDNKIPVAHSILDISPQKIGLYSNWSVLNSIVQLQMYLSFSGK